MPSSEQPSDAVSLLQAPTEDLSFEALYQSYLPFVWRSARRLGAQEMALEDIAQEVFVVVHRRLGDFEARSSVRTWIYGIVVRVVRDHRRTIRRKRLGAQDRADDEVLYDLASPALSPEEAVATRDALGVLHLLLATLDDDKREVFVLSELEELSAKEIAEVTGVPLNTVYSRLRAARRAFDEALARHRAREPAAMTTSPSPSRPLPQVPSQAELDAGVGAGAQRSFWGGLWPWSTRKRANASDGRKS